MLHELVSTDSSYLNETPSSDLESSRCMLKWNLNGFPLLVNDRGLEYKNPRLARTFLVISFIGSLRVKAIITSTFYCSSINTIEFWILTKIESCCKASCSFLVSCYSTYGYKLTKNVSICHQVKALIRHEAYELQIMLQGIKFTMFTLGPLQWPLIGNLAQVVAVNSVYPHLAFTELAKTYGPLAFYRMGMVNMGKEK